MSKRTDGINENDIDISFALIGQRFYICNTKLLSDYFPIHFKKAIISVSECNGFRQAYLSICK